MEKIYISRSINIISRNLRNKYKRNFKKFNINESQYQYMIYLYNATKPVCQEDLVIKFNIDKAAVARGIKNLIDEGYIIKLRSLEDKRLYHLTLTNKAEMIRKDFFEILDNINNELLNDFNEEELLLLDSFLNRLT